MSYHPAIIQKTFVVTHGLYTLAKAGEYTHLKGDECMTPTQRYLLAPLFALL